MASYHRQSNGTWKAMVAGRALTRDNIRPQQIFDPNSFWFQRLPNNPPIATDSAAIMARITAAYPGTVSLDRTQYTPEVVVASNSDPLVSFSWDNVTGAASSLNLLTEHLNNVRIPTSAAPASGTDAEIAIWNRDTGQYTDIWSAKKISNTQWSAAWGGTIQNPRSNAGIHVHPYGAVAAGFAFLPGMVMADEVRDGHIPHVVGIGLPKALINSGISAPATRTDGDSATANSISEGQRLILPASVNVQALNVSKVCKMVARAAQEYGLIVWDRGETSWTIRAQNGVGMTTNPWPSLLNNVADPLAGFPMSQMKVMPLDWMPT